VEATESKATEVMAEANRIIEEFPDKKYAFYILVYSIEIALTFWIALKFIRM
jgi:hypothetical protein